MAGADGSRTIAHISDIHCGGPDFVPSLMEPGGVGEPGTPPIAPAVANAVYAATGTRIRKLPVEIQGSR